ncbi:hypothetical protein [Bradyrhizobium sp. 33ap4]|nr:hypothetical protein [Bradyrhizobium sp. 33ap4]
MEAAKEVLAFFRHAVCSGYDGIVDAKSACGNLERAVAMPPA